LTLSETDNALARRFRDEHAVIRADVEQLRVVADCLGHVPPSEARARLRDVLRLLVEEVEPHERAEEAELYTALARMLGTDAMGPMSRGHVEISHQIRRLGQLLDDLGPDGPDAEDVIELRRALYGLHAVLRLHTAQEDESFLSLGEDRGQAAQQSSMGSGRADLPAPRSK
jgi:hypothetical protein